MQVTSRIRRALTIGSAVAIGIGLTASLTATSLPNPGPTPLHNIVCVYTPDIPYQYGAGAPVHGDAHVSCNAPPDISSTTVRVWRLDRGVYYKVAENTSSQTGTDFWVFAVGPCTSTVRYAMHTEVINDSFHGTWGHTDKNSVAVTLAC